MVLKHVDAQQLVELFLVPALHIFLLELLFPGINKAGHVAVIPQEHQA